MAIRKILSIPHPTLYKVSTPVHNFNNQLQKLAIDMFDTMYKNDGVGLAAVQIGVLQRLLVIDLEFAGFAKGVFVNPEIVEQSKEMQYGEEGCLSVPGISVPLARPKWVKIQYQNIQGEEKIIQSKDLMARALLHEMDHLDGKIYVDQLESEIKRSIQEDLNRIQRGAKPLQTKVPEYRKQRKSMRRKSG